MYLLDNRAIQVGKGGMKDLSFLEKSSTSGPYSDFYKKYISPILKEPITKARKTKKMLFKPAFESNGASMILAIELLIGRLVIATLQQVNLL